MQWLKQRKGLAMRQVQDHSNEGGQPAGRGIKYRLKRRRVSFGASKSLNLGEVVKVTSVSAGTY